MSAKNTISKMTVEKIAHRTVKDGEECHLVLTVDDFGSDTYNISTNNVDVYLSGSEIELAYLMLQKIKELNGG